MKLIMNQSIIVFLTCIGLIFIFGKILIVPIKKIVKLIVNSILGGVLLIFINYIGGIFFNFSIGVNIWTSVIVGILGIPGAILLVLIKIFIVN